MTKTRASANGQQRRVLRPGDPALLALMPGDLGKPPGRLAGCSEIAGHGRVERPASMLAKIRENVYSPGGRIRPAHGSRRPPGPAGAQIRAVHSAVSHAESAWMGKLTSDLPVTR